MIKTYFKIAWVNLFRHKGFSILNILGLATGMACAIFILLWVRDELTFDKDQKNYETVHMVMGNRNFNNDIYTDQYVVFPLAKSLEKASPQIKNTVVTSSGDSHIFSYGDKKIKRKGLQASEHFFDIFPFKVLSGDPQQAIRNQSTLVITESTARIIFGDEDPLGKTVTLDGNIPARVSAVIADPAHNSSFDFEYVEPYNTWFMNESLKEWRNSFSFTYIQTVPCANVNTIDGIINAIMKAHAPEDNISSYFTFPMSDWHLKSEFRDGTSNGGMIEYVRLFAVIAVIILLIACINFMNLSTARSEKKAKEVGIRKTLGSSKKQLVIQFFCESILLTCIAFGFAILLVYLLLPSFNTMVNKELSLKISEPFIWISASLIILFTGLVAGSYPALYLSSFNPVKVLKGTNFNGKALLLPRRVLVTAQFVISISLISATLIVYRQIQHIKNRPTGYASENLIDIKSTIGLSKNYAAIKHELLRSGAVEGLSRASSPITEIYWNTPSPKWQGKSEDGDLGFTGLMTDLDFVRTLGLKVLQGTYFSGVPSDSSAVVLNKTAVEAMGLKDPVGTELIYGPGPNPDLWSRKYTIIGVVEDIVMVTPYKPVSPLMIYEIGHNAFDALHARLNRSMPASESLKKIESVLKKHNPAYPFEYTFVDEEFNRKFLTEHLIGKLTNIFAGLAIFLCCIGLAGLTAFTIEKRTREIGIRKLLGATVMQLAMLIANEFILLVLIAFVITIPLTWLLMDKWLQNYSFRTNINLWLFGAVGLFTLTLTLIVVVLNTLKTAIANPVKNLRTE